MKYAQVISMLVEGAFDADMDYAQFVKIYDASPDSAKELYSPAEGVWIKKMRVEGDPDERQINDEVWSVGNIADDLYGEEGALIS